MNEGNPDSFLLSPKTHLIYTLVRVFRETKDYNSHTQFRVSSVKQAICPRLKAIEDTHSTIKVFDNKRSLQLETCCLEKKYQIKNQQELNIEMTLVFGVPDKNNLNLDQK